MCCVATGRALSPRLGFLKLRIFAFNCSEILFYFTPKALYSIAQGRPAAKLGIDVAHPGSGDPAASKPQRATP